MIKKIQTILNNFLSSEKPYPILIAIAAGLYPFLFYYSRNFYLINTWEHLGYFTFFFLLLPMVLFWLLQALFDIQLVKKWKHYVLPFLNVFTFLFLLEICLYAEIRGKLLVVIFIIAILFAFYLNKHLKKLVILELFLASLAFIMLLPVLLKNLSGPDTWTIQPDEISQVVFKKKPNVYFIQPDGYVNYSELEKGHYYFNNREFEAKMDSFGFKSYPNFRSNYATTLSSNSSTFTMKHHYYVSGSDLSEGFDSRSIIMGDNPVLDVFKKNGYTTHFISELPYLLLNRPKVGYDKSNYDVNEIPFISTGLKGEKNVLTSLKNSYDDNFGDLNHFFFIEFFNPGHISNQEKDSRGKEGEREEWLEGLKVSNQKLIDLITTIKKNDPESLILIMADHGGFVGMDYTKQLYTKTSDRDLIYSIFSTNLSIHWPDNDSPDFDTKLKTSVNLFRYVFSYLSGDKSYLNHLQEDSSFVIIRNGAPKGVYKYINASGEISFETQDGQ